MKALIFDFDSTLIVDESLEVLLQYSLQGLIPACQLFFCEKSKTKPRTKRKRQDHGYGRRGYHGPNQSDYGPGNERRDHNDSILQQKTSFGKTFTGFSSGLQLVLLSITFSFLCRFRQHFSSQALLFLF